MRIIEYFLKRPVAAIILNAMILLMGALCFNIISLREYPEVVFNKLSITANYPNASPETVETSVTSPLEDALSRVEGVETMVSRSNDGSATIEMTFSPDISMDRALISVRDAVGLARWYLPKEVKDPVIERKTTTSSGSVPFFVIALESDAMDFSALTHYANLNLKNEFRGLKGVGSVDVWGQPYTYKITLDPKKLYNLGVNPDEVYRAVSLRNQSFGVGKYRDEIPTTLDTRLHSVEDYENVIVKMTDAAYGKRSPLLLKMLGDVELGTEDRQLRVEVNGKPGIILAINRANDANPLDVSNAAIKRVKELQKVIPKHIKMSVVVDQAKFIRSSLSSVESAILEATFFVLLVVFFFLRSFRATLIPLVTIPISLVGALLLLKMFGCSINIITMLAMVLAVGLVVDDAIVVLENIARHIEGGLSPLNAALKGGKEIGFAILAMTFTLASVYAPLAFIEGTIGQIFIEFALALAGSVLISGVVALTLSPLMCARILSSREKHYFPKVDVWLEALSSTYERLLHAVIKRGKIASILLCILAIGAIFLFRLLPGAIAPSEDRGLLGIWIPPIPGLNMDGMQKKIREMEAVLRPVPEAENRIIFLGSAWGASVCYVLKPLEERKRSADEIQNALQEDVKKLPEPVPFVWNWNSGLPGIEGESGGGSISLEVSTSGSYEELFVDLAKLRESLDKKKLFTSVRQDLALNTLGYKIHLDENMLAQTKLTTSQVSKAIEVFFSGDQSLTFYMNGILYPITIQGSEMPWTLNEIYLTNPDGHHVSLAALATMESTGEAKELLHYNRLRSTKLTADLKEGETVATAMEKLEHEIRSTLPPQYKTTWTGSAKLYLESSGLMLVLFCLAIIFIYAILSLQFGNFIDPLIVLLTVPFACVGALSITWALGQTVNIYTEVGLITLIGLITKHGILIVEFTNQSLEEGLKLIDAVQKAATLRLRPILMTTSAMIFGALPLVLTHSAGAESRRVLGIVLVSGLSLGTCLTLFMLPTLCYFIKSFVQKTKKA